MMRLHPDCIDCQLTGRRCVTCDAVASQRARDRAFKSWRRRQALAFVDRKLADFERAARKRRRNA